MTSSEYSKYYEYIYRHLLIKLHVLCAHYNRFKEVEAPLLKHLKVDYLDKMLTGFGRRLDRVQEKINVTWPRLDDKKFKVSKAYDAIALEINDIMEDGCRIAFLPAEFKVPVHMYSENIVFCDCVNYTDFWEPTECIDTGIFIDKIKRRNSL